MSEVTRCLDDRELYTMLKNLALVLYTLLTLSFTTASFLPRDTLVPVQYAGPPKADSLQKSAEQFDSIPDGIISARASNIHGVGVTDNCFEAYRSTFLKTMAVTNAVQTLINVTSSLPVLRIPGLAAWKSAVRAQQIFTEVNQKLYQPLTDDDHANLMEARNEEIGVSVFIGLVIHSQEFLTPTQKRLLSQFQSVAQAERVARMLVDQSCPELTQAIEIKQR